MLQMKKNTDQEVTMMDVYQEFDDIANKYKIMKHRSKVSQRKQLSNCRIIYNCYSCLGQKVYKKKGYKINCLKRESAFALIGI